MKSAEVPPDNLNTSVFSLETFEKFTSRDTSFKPADVICACRARYIVNPFKCGGIGDIAEANNSYLK